MSLDPIVSDLQKLNPSAIIELFKLQLDQAIHGATTSYHFHAGTNANVNGKVVWQGTDYLRYPVEATGFAYKNGKLPRPQITISNAKGYISAILSSANTSSSYLSDLSGSTVTRIRTLVKFLDNANFSGNNPYGTPANNEFPREVYYVDRKLIENREIVTFELASAADLAGVRVPKRQCTRELFPSIGTFIG